MDLRSILQQVADGTLDVNEAERRIRMPETAKPRLTNQILHAALRPKAPIWLLSLFFSVMGTVFAVFGFVECLRLWNFSNRGLETEGIVVRRIFKGAGDGHPRSAPIVRYKIGDKSYEVEGSTSLTADVGVSVPVAYLPERPNEARIATFQERWMEPLMFGLIGGTFAIMGIALFFANRRETMKAQTSG